MQWSPDENAGFSTAPARKLVAPVVEGGFGPEHINVEDQRHDPDSLLNFVATLIRQFRESPEIGWGEYELLDQPHDAVLAHRCTWQGSSVIALHNFAAEPCTVPLELKSLDGDAVLVDLLQPGRTPLEEGRAELTLDGYGYRWLRISRPDELRLA
jgi:glycosidase